MAENQGKFLNQPVLPVQNLVRPESTLPPAVRTFTSSLSLETCTPATAAVPKSAPCGAPPAEAEDTLLTCGICGRSQQLVPPASSSRKHSYTCEGAPIGRRGRRGAAARDCGRCAAELCASAATDRFRRCPALLSSSNERGFGTPAVPVNGGPATVFVGGPVSRQTTGLSRFSQPQERLPPRRSRP